MASLPKLQRRHGWFCHLIGLYLSYLSIRSQKQRSDGQVPVFIIYAKQIRFRRRLKLSELNLCICISNYHPNIGVSSLNKIGLMQKYYYFSFP